MPTPLIPVLALLDKVDYLKGTRVVSWPELQQQGTYFATQDELLRHHLEIGARGMAQKFTEHLLKHSKIRQAHEPQGLVLSMNAYAFEHGELVDLLTKAYEEGQRAIRHLDLRMGA
jgi:hypothetical protein